MYAQPMMYPRGRGFFGGMRGRGMMRGMGHKPHFK